MQNTLLVGLSRQVVLERQMDVVANNIANINTSGYKADRSLFQEFLATNAHEDNFVPSDRRVSFVQDRATFHDFSQGPSEETKNPLDVAIDGAGFLAVQTPAGERYTRDGNLQINNQGQLVTQSGYPVLGNSGPIVFQQTDKAINIAQDGNVTVLEGTNRVDSVRGKLRVVSFAQAQRLVKEGANLYSARRRQRRASGYHLAAAPGLCREVQRQFRDRDGPHDRDHADLHPDLLAAAATERPAQIGDRKARRRSGLTEGH
jgi:flagellar basal-body rod protein FlgF